MGKLTKGTRDNKLKTKTTRPAAVLIVKGREMLSLNSISPTPLESFCIICVSPAELQTSCDAWGLTIPTGLSFLLGLRQIYRSSRSATMVWPGHAEKDTATQHQFFIGERGRSNVSCMVTSQGHIRLVWQIRFTRFIRRLCKRQPKHPYGLVFLSHKERQRASSLLRCHSTMHGLMLTCTLLYRCKYVRTALPL